MKTPIRVGDLVQVVKPSRCPQGGNDGLGHTFIVKEIIPNRHDKLCFYCGKDHDRTNGAWDGDSAWAVYRLKRVPPLEELEGEKRDETVSA